MTFLVLIWPSGMVYEGNICNNYMNSKNCWYQLVETGTLSGFFFLQFHKEAMNQIYSVNQKQELNRPLTRALKQEARDSPCCHQRGTDLQQKTPRRLAPAKAAGEIRPSCTLIIRLQKWNKSEVPINECLKQTKDEQQRKELRSLGSKTSYANLWLTIWDKRNHFLNTVLFLCFGIFLLVLHSSNFLANHYHHHHHYYYFALTDKFSRKNKSMVAWVHGG